MRIHQDFYFHRRFPVGFVCFLLATVATAQTEAEIRRYRSGVLLVQQGDYLRGKSELAPLTNNQAAGLAPYAHYYHALADYKQKRYTEARLMLKQLLDRYPDWKKKDEAYYLLAATDFETGQYEAGAENLRRISDPVLKNDVNQLETTFYSRLEDLRRLKSLQKSYPENRNLALALIGLIQRTSTDKADLELSDRLTNRFGVPASNGPATGSPLATTTRPGAAGSQSGMNSSGRSDRRANKGYFNVAVLFPFRINELDPSQRARSNQYAIDLYNGMKVAKNKLQSEGITINLFAYDIDNDTNKVSALLVNPAFQQNDLIIGPLYAEPNRLVANYAQANGIALINPIATSRELVANQPMAFLAAPSLNQQAEKAAAFGLSFPGPKKALLYFGATRKDSTLAALYLSELKRNGFQRVDAVKIGPDFEDSGLMETGKPSHIFLASSDEKAGVRLLQSLQRQQVTIPVIATSTAFDFETISLNQFLKSEVYLLYPDYTDTQRPQVEEFEEQYLEYRNIIPSTYAYQGYDMVLFFGRMLARNRGQLTNRSGLRGNPDEGYLLSGYDYTASNENGIVPIVKFDGTRFIQVK